MPDAPETPEPPPQGRVASAARELRWWGRFLAGINGEQAPRYVALALTFAMGALVVWNEIKEVQDIEGKREELAIRLTHENSDREQQRRWEAAENEKGRLHDAMLRDRERSLFKSSIDALVRNDKDFIKSLTQMYFEIQGLKKAMMNAFPGKVFFDFFPGVFGALDVAPMPRPISVSVTRNSP